MSSKTCFLYSVICYGIVCVRCTTIFVATAPVNPVDSDLRNRQKLLERDVISDEKLTPFGWKFRQESPHEGVSIGDWTDKGFFQKFRESMVEENVLFSVDECTRYCIGNGNKNNDDFQYINLFWKANIVDTTEDVLPNGLSRLMSEISDGQRSTNSSRKCRIYLDLNCNTTETGTATNYPKTVSKIFNKTSYRPYIKLAKRTNSSENTETKFMVDPVIRRLVIDVDGNVSSVVLRIPTVSWPHDETVIIWSRKANAGGLRIDARNPPPGEWWMKLMGEENTKYHLNVEGFVDENRAGELFSPEAKSNENFDTTKITPYRPNIELKRDLTPSIEEKSDNFVKTADSDVIETEQRNLDATGNSKLVGREISRERSLERRTNVENQSEQTTEEESNNNESSMIVSSTDNTFINYAEYVTFMDNNRNATVPKELSNNDKSLETMLLTEEQGELHSRSSIDAIENLDIDNTDASKANNVDVSVRAIETLDNQELSEELEKYSNENTIEERKMLVEVNRNSNLLATPGTIHRIIFDVMNNCVLPVRYTFRVKSTPFKVYNVQPPYAWIYPGQMTNVAVDLIVPDNAAPDTANTVTFFILGTEIKEKSVYVYVQGSVSKLTDDVKPKIEYSFNNNCAGKLEKNRCYKSYWSMDITIEDYDSGLKRVISSPRNIYPRTEFISGTRSPITFYYSATCCDTTAKITAIDLLDNYNTYTVDVTVWNNLSEAEIAAITVGALLALLFIVLIVILIIYCFRRKKSHDLPYTQRYGSRPPASADRTTF